jgi:hypothetical protein
VRIPSPKRAKRKVIGLVKVVKVRGYGIKVASARTFIVSWSTFAPLRIITAAAPSRDTVRSQTAVRGTDVSTTRRRLVPPVIIILSTRLTVLASLVVTMARLVGKGADDM